MTDARQRVAAAIEAHGTAIRSMIAKIGTLIRRVSAYHELTVGPGWVSVAPGRRMSFTTTCDTACAMDQLMISTTWAPRRLPWWWTWWLSAWLLRKLGLNAWSYASPPFEVSLIVNDRKCLQLGGWALYIAAPRRRGAECTLVFRFPMRVIATVGDAIRIDIANEELMDVWAVMPVLGGDPL